MPGMFQAKCMSLHKIGFPVLLFTPSTTQLFEPIALFSLRSIKAFSEGIDSTLFRKVEIVCVTFELSFKGPPLKESSELSLNSP